MTEQFIQRFTVSFIVLNLSFPYRETINYLSILKNRTFYQINLKNNSVDKHNLEICLNEARDFMIELN